MYGQSRDDQLCLQVAHSIDTGLNPTFDQVWFSPVHHVVADVGDEAEGRHVGLLLHCIPQSAFEDAGQAAPEYSAFHAVGPAVSVGEHDLEAFALSHLQSPASRVKNE